MSREPTIAVEGAGALVKITGVSDDGHRIFCLKTNGESVVLRTNAPVDIEPGMVVVATPDGFIPAPDDVWYGENQLAVVVKKEDDYLVVCLVNS